MFDFLTYKRIIALVVLALIVWVAIILYRVGREGVIKRIDFWKSKWKIVLFWIVIAAVAGVVLYYLNKYGFLE